MYHRGFVHQLLFLAQDPPRGPAPGRMNSIVFVVPLFALCPIGTLAHSALIFVKYAWEDYRPT